MTSTGLFCRECKPALILVKVCWQNRLLVSATLVALASLGHVTTKKQTNGAVINKARVQDKSKFFTGVFLVTY